MRYFNISFLIAFLLFICSGDLLHAQTVTTDKADYMPGETVIITGTGWWAGETVNMVLDHLNCAHPDEYLSAVADSQVIYTTIPTSSTQLTSGSGSY